VIHRFESTTVHTRANSLARGEVGGTNRGAADVEDEHAF
jgi:hypothetical protein